MKYEEMENRVNKIAGKYLEIKRMSMALRDCQLKQKSITSDLNNF